MSDVKRLTDLFESGKLLHPISDVPNIIDFSNALSYIVGIQDGSLTPNASAIKEAIGEPDHLVFVLVDGLGMNFVEAMDREAFIPSHVTAEMRTVFPSTTPTALTSLATGKWPGQHAIMGWFTFIPEIDDVTVIIRHQRASDEKPLSELGTTPEKAYPVPSAMAYLSRDSLFLMPDEIAGTTYSQYWNGGLQAQGYKEMPGAFDAVARQVGKAKSQTFTYLYLPQVDRTAHEHGANHAKTWKRVSEVNALMEKLASALPQNATMIMTADHGHLDAEKEFSYTIPSLDDELMQLSSRKPSGDIRVTYLSVKDSDLAKFKKLCKERYGDDFVVITTEEAEGLNLFGPHPLSPEARARLGNVMLISTGTATLDFRHAIENKEKKLAISHHSGLTPSEMRIPLVVV